MKRVRTYQEMTFEEKRHSVDLWSKYYQSYKDEDFITSWHYWNQRIQFLNDIGVSKHKEKEMNTKTLETIDV